MIIGFFFAALTIYTETIVGIDSKIHRGFCARFAKEGEQLVGFVYERSLCPWLWPDSVFAFTRQGTKEKQFVDFAQQFARHLIQQKRKENIKVGGRLKAFCDHLVQLLINRKLSEAEVIDEINTFLAAGHHTTSITLTFTIWLLANHSNVLRQLQQEVDDHFKTIEQEPNHVQRLPFLDAVLRESLRLYPPIPAVGRWNGRNFSQTVNGRSYRIPKGVNVVVPIYFLHRNPIFYERPNTFDPNRFLNSDRVADKSWLAFSFGARNCIGYRFAMTQLKITLAHLCRHFDFRVSVHQKFTLGMSISITTSDPIRVQFKSRVCRRSKESHQSQ